MLLLKCDHVVEGVECHSHCYYIKIALRSLVALDDVVLLVDHQKVNLISRLPT
jgi:hypothetical protein